MSLRLTSTKTKLEEMGEETEFACETLSEYRDVILGLTADTTAPVDIFDANGQYKNTTQIIRELSEVVDQLDTKQLNALMNTLFGKRQGNIGASLLQNFDMVEKSIDIAKKSSEGIGSAMEEQNRWAESLEAKMGKVEAIFESISSKIFDSDSLKGIYDTIIKVMDSIDKVIGNGQGLQLLTGAVGAILGGSGNGFINVNTISGFWVEAEAGISKYNKALTEGKEAQRSVAIEMQKTNVGLSNYLLSLDGANASTKGYIAYTIKATAASVGLRIATTALNAALNAGIMWLIGTGFSALSAWINHNKEITKSLEETSSKLNNAIESLDDYKSKIDEIASSEEDEHQKLVELNEINDELADKYGLEVEKINDVTKAREALNDALEEEVKRRRAIYLAEGEEAYNVAKNKVSDNYDGNFWGSLFGTASGKESSLNEGTGKFTLRKGFFSEGAEISDRIKELFDNVKEGTNNGLKELKFTLGESARDEIEYFDILEAKVLEFNKIRDNPTIKLTKDEEALYQLMLKQYESLKEHNGDYIENIKNYSRQKALSILDEIKEARYENREAYTAALMLRAGDDRYVKDAIQDLIGATDEAISKAEELANSNPLSILLGNIQKIKNEAKEISEGIQEADESFEKLNKVLDDNENMDNFFSSSEIIELLETYPELSDAILETAYGYKIEEEALETLREARIEEKKTALQAQLDETQGLLEYTNQKLAIYRQELGGIQDVAEARVKLAELEAELAGLSPEAFHHRKSKRNDLEQQRNLYQDFIDTSEAAAKQEAELKKLDTQLAVLGNRYTKATDATKDQTDALKNQKDALSELSKEYDDAQKAIEDLIKLTMDMIKKNKELEKEALSDQIKNFKALIDKRKEYLDTLKEERDFNKDLAEQNKDLLQIQLELDALSVEGISYSLEDMKRKAELESELAEQQSKREDFLFDHEIDVRKDALDKEAEAYEDSLNVRIKELEDYISKEGRIRQDAIDLINGKSEEFYNNLLEYNMTYTDRSRYEFQKLWDSAYSAILKYANGELNVELALINLINAMDLAEQQIKNIESAIDSVKNATDDAKLSALEYQKVIGDTVPVLAEMAEEAAKAMAAPTVTPQGHSYWSQPTDIGKVGSSWTDKRAQQLLAGFLPKFHDGGIVGGISNEKGEVLAKLLSGEVVATEAQARNFMEHTLPKLASNNYTTNNSSVAPVINIGDIVVNGNADSSILNKLNEVRQNIVDDVFKVVNNQRNTFAGGRVRAY